MTGILAISVMAGNQAKKKKTGPSSGTGSAVSSEISSETSEKSAASTVVKETENSDSSRQADGDLKNGVYTIRIKSSSDDKNDYYWESYKGDKGDASFVELIEETNRKKGLAYEGSFRAMEDTTDQGDAEDTIRIVHTDGTVVDEYMEFTVEIHDGKIIEADRGSSVLPTPDDTFSPVLCGTWQEKEKGSMTLNISQNPEGGFDLVLSEKTGRKAEETAPFTAKYDCILNAFLYKENCLIALDPSSEEEKDIRLYLHDNELTGGEDLTFVKTGK